MDGKISEASHQSHLGEGVSDQKRVKQHQVSTEGPGGDRDERMHALRYLSRRNKGVKNEY